MKSFSKFWRRTRALPEEQRKALVWVVVIILAIITYIIWNSTRINRLESPAEETADTGYLQNLNTEDKDTAKILSPLQGLTDSLKNLKEIFPDKPAENGYLQELKNVSNKVWQYIYNYLP